MSCSSIDGTNRIVSSLSSKRRGEILRRVQSLLQRDRSINEHPMETNSEELLQNRLIDLLNEYFIKQDQVRKELANKQKFLFDYEQTQRIAQQEIQQNFRFIQAKFLQLVKESDQVNRSILHSSH